MRWPRTLYLTLLNTDEAYKEIDHAITVNYWIEPVDPEMKVEDIGTDLIQPKWKLELNPIGIGTVRSRYSTEKTVEDDDDILDLILLIAFLIALVAFCAAAITYYVLRMIKKKKQLEKAIAEGTVTLRPIDDDTDGNEESPEKQGGIEM